MAIARDQIPTIAEAPSEEVQYEPLGVVRVRGFDLPQLMTYAAALRESRAPRGTETVAQAEQRAMSAAIPLALAMTVLADDGEPVFSEAQWRVFGARHPAQTLALHEVAMRLSGQDDEADKKKG